MSEEHKKIKHVTDNKIVWWSKKLKREEEYGKSEGIIMKMLSCRMQNVSNNAAL